ncbi:MAG TPA: protein kinase [Gemmatimonadales bacterium]|nr:protein kinase [Gemmatimonadales bacterium]
MTCPRCGAEGIPDGAPGCPKCGQTLGDEQNRTNNAAVEDSIPEELEDALRRELSKEYQITDLLGRGGMSLVYLAQELDLNRQVAIKILPLQFLQGPASAERFEREAKIAASLDHPHIVPIFRVGATSTFLWYTMKRIRGRSLEQIIVERGALPLPEVLGVVEQVGSALQYAHRHGVVHRDVKPANVMIEDSGWALVCDFGVARAFGSVSLTQTGASLGTPRYMSPEQFEGQPVDGRCDQYSLAILMWEALTGAVPFTGDSLGELIRKHLLEPPPRLIELKPEIPQRVSDAVHHAMSKRPGERFPDVAAFVAALGGQAVPRIPAGFTGPQPVAQRARILWDTPDNTPTVRITATRRGRRLIAAAVVAGLALLGGGAWVAFRPAKTANGATPASHDSTPQRGTDTQRVATVVPADTPVTRRTTAPRPRPTVPPVARAKLSLSTQPPGQLFLDDQPIRSTPILNFELAPGQHRVQVKRDGFTPFDTVFTAQPGQEIKWTRIALKPIGG